MLELGCSENLAVGFVVAMSTSEGTIEGSIEGSKVGSSEFRAGGLNVHRTLGPTLRSDGEASIFVGRCVGKLLLIVVGLVE
jgi:hypothetical protein